MSDCIEVIKPFAAALHEEHLGDVQIIGGICTAALKHPDTVILFDSKEVIAPSTLTLSTIRNDSNRTLRDLDVFVPTSETARINRVKKLLDDTVRGELDPSVFGLKPQSCLQQKINNPLGAAAMTFVSDRFEWENDTLVKSLFPLSVPMDRDSIEPWTLSVGDLHVSIPNPAMAIINYLCRSITGLRPKDQEKIEELVMNVFRKETQLRDWAIDGEGKSQVELGLLLRSFTPNKQHTDLLGLNRRILTIPELAEDPAFMMPNMEHIQKVALLGAMSVKACGLAAVEPIEIFRSGYQSVVERTPFGSKIVDSD